MLTKRPKERFSVKRFIGRDGRDEMRKDLVMPTSVRQGVAGRRGR